MRRQHHIEHQYSLLSKGKINECVKYVFKSCEQWMGDGSLWHVHVLVYPVEMVPLPGSRHEVSPSKKLHLLQREVCSSELHRGRH